MVGVWMGAAAAVCISVYLFHRCQLCLHVPFQARVSSLHDSSLSLIAEQRLPNQHRCVAMRREKGISMGGPNGGSGGRGGSIFLECAEGLNTLAGVRNKVHYRATDGQNGQGKSRTGNAGGDIYVSAPLGTVVRDQDGTLCGELTEHGQHLLVARGGRGGRGNEAFKTGRSRAPRFGEKGEPGGERWLSLELKLVADVGFVGVPNAGKSTLLAVSSNAKPKIADYPFTTVTPNLGVCDVLGDDDTEGSGLVLADIPGLLEGAHNGVGLGLAFLRHVQRCRVLVHVVSGDSLDPLGDYRAIQQELQLFSPKLLEKQQVIIQWKRYSTRGLKILKVALVPPKVLVLSGRFHPDAACLTNTCTQDGEKIASSAPANFTP